MSSSTEMLRESSSGSGFRFHGLVGSVKAANCVGRRIASALAGEAQSAPQRFRPMQPEDFASVHRPLPDEEWSMILELTALPDEDCGYLALSSHPSLNRLLSRGLADRHDGPTESLSYWHISSAGSALLAALDAAGQVAA